MALSIADQARVALAWYHEKVALQRYLARWREEEFRWEFHDYGRIMTQEEAAAEVERCERLAAEDSYYYADRAVYLRKLYGIGFTWKNVIPPWC